MKKGWMSVLLLMALVAGKTNAQVKENLSFGPIVGIGHTTLSGDLEGEANRKLNPSVNAGVRLTYSAQPHLGFGIDLTYRTEGAKIGSTTGKEEIRFRSNYIRIDPKAYYFFSEAGQAFRPKVSIGPSLGFLAGGKLKFFDGSTVTGEGKISEYIKSFDLGVAAGVGFNYRLKSALWLNVDATYTHGLLDVAKESGTDDATRNRSLFLNVGVLFGIGSANAR